jgi:hypothetical protein
MLFHFPPLFLFFLTTLKKKPRAYRRLYGVQPSWLDNVDLIIAKTNAGFSLRLVSDLGQGGCRVKRKKRTEHRSHAAGRTFLTWFWKASKKIE